MNQPVNPPNQQTAGQQGGGGFDESKYQEIMCQPIPHPKFKDNGIEIVVYYYNDPQRQYPPTISLRSYFPDRNDPSKIIRMKGTKLDSRMMGQVIDVLTQVKAKIDSKYSQQQPQQQNQQSPQ